MNMWNSSPCQSGGISYPWFQSQSSGAQERINLYFDSGVSDITGADGSTACAIYGNGAVPEIRMFSQFEDIHGNLHSCDTVDLGLKLAHELGHYLGLNHTSTSSVCSRQLMYPALSGDETLQPIECQAADNHNETGWESGDIGCTDSDWCDPDHCSPILIDFDGDLFQLSGVDRPVTFDIDGNSRPRRIGWTRRRTDDGFLCRDLDGNGKIDSGAELFGTATRLADGTLAANGYEAMAELDRPQHGGNGDGYLSELDEAFPELCIWWDRNRNGHSERREIRPVQETGLLSMGLSYGEFPRLDEHNNLLLYHGGATVLRDGLEVHVRTVDVFFAGRTP